MTRTKPPRSNAKDKPLAWEGPPAWCMHEVRLFPREGYDTRDQRDKPLEPEDAWRMRTNSGSIDKQVAKLFPPSLRYSDKEVSIYGDMVRPDVMIRKDQGGITAFAFRFDFLLAVPAFLATLFEFVEFCRKRRLIILDREHGTVEPDMERLAEVLLTSEGARQAMELQKLSKDEYDALRRQHRTT